MLLHKGCFATREVDMCSAHPETNPNKPINHDRAPAESEAYAERHSALTAHPVASCIIKLNSNEFHIRTFLTTHWTAKVFRCAKNERKQKTENRTITKRNELESRRIGKQQLNDGGRRKMIE